MSSYDQILICGPIVVVFIIFLLLVIAYYSKNNDLSFRLSRWVSSPKVLNQMGRHLVIHWTFISILFVLFVLAPSTIFLSRGHPYYFLGAFLLSLLCFLPLFIAIYITRHNYKIISSRERTMNHIALRLINSQHLIKDKKKRATIGTIASLIRKILLENNIKTTFKGRLPLDTSLLLDELRPVISPSIVLLIPSESIRIILEKNPYETRIRRGPFIRQEFLIWIDSSESTIGDISDQIIMSIDNETHDYWP